MTETTQVTQAELLPCPFCGGSKILVSQTIDQAAPNWYATCHRTTCAFTGYSSTEAEAITAWNTRADSHHRLVGVRNALRAFHDGKLSRSETIAKIDAALKEAGRG